MIKVLVKGDRRANGYLEKMLNIVGLGGLDKYGRQGVEALRLATPVDTGKTANSWDYSIERIRDVISVTWFNKNVVNGVNIAIILNYGHGTRNGGYVKGRNYINPAIQPIFDQMVNDMWGEVKNS